MKWSSALIAIFLFLLMINAANASYWFQFGARAGPNSDFNQGASMIIQTVNTLNISTGSPAFWIGEDLDNGAFLQMGYTIVNQTGSYPSYCVPLYGCTQYENINASQAEWFYEYFPQGYGGNSFLGGLGPAGSAGVNGTFNRYGFYYDGNNWDFLFNGNVVGKVNLNSASSGVHTPVGFGELANASNASAVIEPVIMENMSIYKNGEFTPVSEGLSYVGYGDGSQKNLPVPYGVRELENRVNYFQVGSGIAIPPNNTVLWGNGYYLNIKSQYGSLNSSKGYISYAKVPINAPRVVNIGSNIRVVFTRWIGSNVGSYSGPLNDTVIEIDGNVTETAQWQLQYFVTVSSSQEYANGTGWYAANSTAQYGIGSNVVYPQGNTRYVFEGWSNGVGSTASTVKVTGPLNIYADWQKEYLVNVTSQYGNVSGDGWYPAGSNDVIAVSPTVIGAENGTRTAFYSWSNGEANSSMAIDINAPVSLYAVFKKEYLYNIEAVDQGNNRVRVSGFYLNGSKVNSTAFLFDDEVHNITGAYYEGLFLPIEGSVAVGQNSTAIVRLPLYNVEITTKDPFGIPVDASVFLRFSNGTTLRTSSGNSGVLDLSDVPYGNATGVVSYFLLKYNVDSRNGVPISLIFLTYLDLVALFAVIIIGAIVYIIVSRKHHESTVASYAYLDKMADRQRKAQ